MNDFLNDYDYFYHYTDAVNENSIRERGLEPRTPSTRAGSQEADLIACLANLTHTKENLSQRRFNRLPTIICRIANTSLIPLRIGLDWSTQRTHLDVIHPFSILSQVDYIPVMRHSIDEIGVLACYDTIPPGEIEFLTIDDLLGPESPPEFPPLISNDDLRLPPMPESGEMKLIDFLLANRVPLVVTNYKVHLASHSNDSPLQAYFDGWFQEWQEWQKNRNWECAHIVSLIQLPERDKWLFAGVYKSLGHSWVEEKKLYRYRTELVPGHDNWIGRVIVHHERGGRASYLWGNEDGAAYTLSEIRAEPMRIEEFPGFNWARVPYAKLKTIVTQEVPSWKHALSNVKGIYLITDTHTGKQYVGKADGESGIWQRWCCYMAFGHGGNKDLRELLGNNSEEYLQHFQFSILEIADFQTSDQEIDGRESHWKEVLKSRRPFGYNAN